MGIRNGISLLNMWVILFSVVCLITDVKSVILNISPGTNIQAGAQSLTVRCQPTTGEVSSIYKLNIKRNNSGTDDIMGTVEVGKSPVLGTGFGSPKYTATGSIKDTDSVSTAFLQVVIQEPSCNDKGEYLCIVTGAASDGSTATPEKRTPVTVQENPSNINMYITPRNSEYDINTTISMACNGNVGNPRKTWQWHTRRFPASTSSTQWVRLTDGVEDKDVTPPTGASCSYRQQTTLTYVVKQQDDGLQIRCILDNSEDFAWNFTINLKGQSNTGGGNADPNTGDEPVDAGMIAGIVLGVLVLIVIIVIVVVVVLKKKKTPGKDYDTGESGKGPDSGMPPPSHDPKYDNRNNDYDHRGGVVNKSLDEPHETKPKPYNVYQNNGGGRHNPGMDDSMSDDRSRVEYPAEDGTDIRGSNAMLGSAV